MWSGLTICFVSGLFLFISFYCLFSKPRKLIFLHICFGLNWFLFNHCSFCSCLKKLVVYKGLYDMANLMTKDKVSFYIQRRYTLKAVALKMQILSVPILILDKTFLLVWVSSVLKLRCVSQGSYKVYSFVFVKHGCKLLYK